MPSNKILAQNLENLIKNLSSKFTAVTVMNSKDMIKPDSILLKFQFIFNIFKSSKMPGFMKSFIKMKYPLALNIT